LPLPRSNSRPTLAPLAGAALLTALALWSLPWKEGLGRPHTLVDRSTARALAPGFLLLDAAARVVPEKASFVVRTEPPDARFETWYHRLGVALLPGRRALVAASLGRFTPPADWSGAEYLVLVGPPPAEPPGELVLTAPGGTVWRRRS
jgi:hypothetical protein